MRSFEETLASPLPHPCLNKRRAAKPAVYFGLQRRPGLAGRQPRIEGYNRRHAVARQIVSAAMSQRAHRISSGRGIAFRSASKQFAWMAKSLCSYFLLSQRSDRCAPCQNARLSARIPECVQKLRCLTYVSLFRLRIVPITLCAPHAPISRRHQLHAPVERAAGVRCVGSDRRQQADASGAQPRLHNPKTLHQLGCDGFGSAL
ncbi:hypothetical protein ACVWWO_006249 [Bradyrhizobium sp. F1.13.1]